VPDLIVVAHVDLAAIGLDLIDFAIRHGALLCCSANALKKNGVPYCP
jgi:hypothetical protein